MPTPTYDLITSQTLSTNATSVTLSSIPASYSDLVLVVVSELSNVDTDYDFLRFNGDAATNYFGIIMRGDGASSASASFSSQNQMWVDGSASTITNNIKNLIIHIMDYSATNKHKTVLMRNNSTTQTVVTNASRWASTSAISSILYRPNSGTLAAGTILSLYGIVS